MRRTAAHGRNLLASSQPRPLFRGSGAAAGAGPPRLTAAALPRHLCRNGHHHHQQQQEGTAYEHPHERHQAKHRAEREAAEEREREQREAAEAKAEAKAEADRAAAAAADAAAEAAAAADGGQGGAGEAVEDEVVAAIRQREAALFAVSASGRGGEAHWVVCCLPGPAVRCSRLYLPQGSCCHPAGLPPRAVICSAYMCSRAGQERPARCAELAPGLPQPPTPNPRPPPTPSHLC